MDLENSGGYLARVRVSACLIEFSLSHSTSPSRFSDSLLLLCAYRCRTLIHPSDAVVDRMGLWPAPCRPAVS